MYDSPVRNKKVGTQTGHVWDTLRLTICKKCVIYNDWIFTTSKLDDSTETVFQTSDGKGYFPIRFLLPFDRSLKDVH